MQHLGQSTLYCMQQLGPSSLYYMQQLGPFILYCMQLLAPPLYTACNSWAPQLCMQQLGTTPLHATVRVRYLRSSLQATVRHDGSACNSWASRLCMRQIGTSAPYFMQHLGATALYFAYLSQQGYIF